jgi:fumarate hydratase class II
VPAERYWGAQTQRSLIHFSIGDDHMPKADHAYGYVKKAAALVNADAGRLDRELADAIVAAAEEVIAGKLDSCAGSRPPRVRQRLAGFRSAPPAMLGSG